MAGTELPHTWAFDHFNVDSRPKRIQIYAFSNDKVLLWRLTQGGAFSLPGTLWKERLSMDTSRRAEWATLLNKVKMSILRISYHHQES